MDAELEQALAEEDQIVMDHDADGRIVNTGYTLGAFNRQCHAAVTGQTDPAVKMVESGHLRYERGRGVVKICEATCSLCIVQGLNDGKWHAI